MGCEPPIGRLLPKSGGMANVGYDGLNRKRFDTMARSRLRCWGGIRTARNHDARATRQGEDARSERSESKAGAVFDGRDKTQARRGAGTPARQQGRRRRRSIATRIVDERRKSARLMSGRERRAAEPPRSVSKMQSAVTNGAASRAHRILDAAISAGLAPEGNLAIAERGKGRRNRPYKCGSTVAPFVTAIYNSIKPQFGCRASGTVRNPLTHYGPIKTAH